jgi:hypothetical protein
MDPAQSLDDAIDYVWERRGRICFACGVLLILIVWVI